MKARAGRSMGRGQKNVSLGVALKSRSCLLSSLASAHTQLHTVPIIFPLASIYLESKVQVPPLGSPTLRSPGKAQVEYFQEQSVEGILHTEPETGNHWKGSPGAIAQEHRHSYNRTDRSMLSKKRASPTEGLEILGTPAGTLLLPWVSPAPAQTTC